MLSIIYLEKHSKCSSFTIIKKSIYSIEKYKQASRQQGIKNDIAKMNAQIKRIEINPKLFIKDKQINYVLKICLILGHLNKKKELIHINHSMNHCNQIVF
ncbi:hypothetical protein TTHERM_000128318 (macronuclear) [Tetrahymena thermophila SB210]|uniref:Uncharacterized protein n=1 Tax=Tetrahymena thermophila (strain SB210) TaxID=312017 RepID=W7X4T2_TETTS|nr:hypothetical protein TTHERM_000128318 [Tetrahymena thermophila SB210]EWS74330.1 hypothetical protein TTHERM_000128318 [Tetrahymena thermophila SB210]|eukprot:XP_012653151.1 hypothetical protein TTHERM_000128318 [Tetrahymena thermophila SB210]